MMDLGVSFYLGLRYRKRDTIDFLNKAKDLGIKKIFTSLQISEAKSYLEDLKEISIPLQKEGIEVIADISREAFNKLGMSLTDLSFLEELGLSGIRLDYGFSTDEIIEMVKNEEEYKIVLNACWPRDTLREILKEGVRKDLLEASFNYYPRPETGLSRGYVAEQAYLLKLQGIRVSAFAPSQKNRRGPLYMGLPTIEKHRDKDPLWCAFDYCLMDHIDTVYLGDGITEEEELEEFASFNEKRAARIRIKTVEGLSSCEKDIVFGTIHENRYDLAELVIRSTLRRDESLEIEPHNNVRRDRYSVTIDNRLYKRYQGEVQITLSDLPSDEKVNVVGKVLKEDWPLIENMKGGSRFYFVSYTA